MRRGLVLFLLINALIIGFLVRSVFTLLTLLVEDASEDAIRRSDIPSPNSSLLESRPQIIPKIIHQTYINESIPERWIEPQQSCIDLHPDYEYIVCLSRAVSRAVSRAILVSVLLWLIVCLPFLAVDERKIKTVYRGGISVVPRDV